jgi:hypothetical protein
LGTSVVYFRVQDSHGVWGQAWPLSFAQDPDSFHGIPPLPVKLVTYLNQGGNVVAGSYAEHPLPGAATGSIMSLVLPLAGVPSAASEFVAYVVSDTGEVSPQAVAPFTVVVQGTNGYASWRALPANFSAGEQAIASISGLQADPDGDGLPNVLEFALGTNPRVSSAPATPLVDLDGGGLRITLRQRAGGSGHRAFGYTASGIQYRVEWSHTLAAGDWRSGGDDAFVVNSVTANGDGTDTVVITAKPTITNGHKTTVLRLKIILL